MAGNYSDIFVTSLYAAPLLVAAFWDLCRYRIPNLVTAAICLFFVACGLIWGVEVNWLSHLLAAGVVLAVGLALFRFKVFGGGDIKLLTALALWIGWNGFLLAFVLYAALLGGALSLALVFLRYALMRFAGPWHVRMPQLFQPGAPVPYGVAVVVGALYFAPNASQFIFFR